MKFHNKRIKQSKTEYESLPGDNINDVTHDMYTEIFGSKKKMLFTTFNGITIIMVNKNE